MLLSGYELILAIVGFAGTSKKKIPAISGGKTIYYHIVKDLGEEKKELPVK